ncbi:MAG: cobaltochelatase subunit CobN, partial [Candidatus Syntrophoarchaeum sp. WYZ-LMO15]
MHKEIGRNRIKGVRILAPLVMVLLVAQLMVPGVTVAQVETAEHRITFVLGTDENLASLVNASVNATVNISIYNETEAKSLNFSNESVVFLASLENETVASINQTINRSAYVVAYNLSSSISIGNVDDVNITKYWVWGGDENIMNLITYMDNRFYGNSTAVDPPEPPEDRAKVAFVVSEKSSYAVWLEKALDDLYITRNLNVSLCTYTHDDPESYKNLNLSDQDAIFLWMIGYPVQDAVHDTVLEAKDKGAGVITIGFTDLYNLSSVNLSSPEYADIATYWANGGTENMRRLFIFIGVKLCDIPVSDFGVDEIPSPVVIPQFGIYHPDAKAEAEGIQGLGIFSSIDDYLTWYKSTGRFNESAPTIGIHYYYVSGKYGSYETLDPLIKKIEDKGANVIFASFSYKDPNTTTYFLKDGKPLVDSVIILNSFRLWHHAEDEGIGYLQQLNVAPIKGIMSYYMNETVWNESNGLSPSEVAWQVALPELDGETEFILFSGKEKDPVSGEYCYRPFDYQLEWITDRAISWAELHRKSNAEKKVAIIYYNHGGGKDNLGASYLDIVPSLTDLLDAMKGEGYDVEGEVPSEDELLDLMLHQGRNVGTWAPDELERMVESGTVILLPASEYESWFNELPEDEQQEVIEKWGEPPGEIMVYENETGEYLVIPGVKLGNVLLAPQPTRGWLQDQAILYHDKELPPHHQYIAFYLWLKKEYGADAIVHFGTHGTQEWLPGKETALSAEEDWPAILIQDLPVVYPYIMDNVGEGTQAKRRGQAVIVDHLTPPIVAGGLYGDLSLMHERIHRYLTTENTTLKGEYRETITGLYENLTLSEDLGVTPDELRAMNETAFEDFINGELHEYLHDLASEFMPYGLHILGSPPDGWKLVSMVESMLGSEFEEHIAEVYPDPHELSPAHENCTVIE